MPPCLGPAKCFPPWSSTLAPDALISLAQLSPECVDRMCDGRGALQCRFLKNASSSLFILFRP